MEGIRGLVVRLTIASDDYEIKANLKELLLEASDRLEYLASRVDELEEAYDRLLSGEDRMP